MWFSFAAGKKTTQSSAVKKIYTGTIQLHRYRFDPLYLRLMALLWEPLKKKTKVIIDEVYVVENLTEKTNYATLQHVHELYFFPLKHRTQKSNLAYSIDCSSTAALHLQHSVQEKPCQKHLTFVWIGLTKTFLPSTFFPSISREVKRKQVFCTGGIIMAACSFCLFDQNTMALCLLHSWTRVLHTAVVESHANEMQSVTMLLACRCAVNNVDWIVLHV